MEKEDWPNNLPDAAIVNCGVSVIQYLDPEDGRIMFSVSYDGEVPLSQSLGILELAKEDLIARSGIR